MKICTQSKSTVLGSINISYKKKKERTVRGRKEKRGKGGEGERKEKG